MAALIVVLNSCRDEDWNPAPDINDNIGAITKLQVNPERTFFNALNPLSDQFVEFTVDVDGFEVTEVSKVEILLTYTENDAIYDELQEIFVDSVYASVVVGEVSSFPATVQFSAQQAAEALGKSVDDFELGDSFNLTFPLYSTDGRKFTVALASELCNQPGQPSFGGCNVAWAIACPSDLGGSYSYSTTVTAAGPGGSAANCVNPVTGTGSLTSLGGGRYAVSDATFGQYDCAWGDTPAAGVVLVDVCNTITLAGADQYGLVYTFTIVANDGENLTIDWFNDYGDIGTSVLTRTDGKLWPEGLTN